MRTKLLLTAAAAAAWMTACVLPGSTYAGDKDWARAGKILAGITVLGIANEVYSDKKRNRHARDRHSRREEVRYVQPVRYESTAVERCDTYRPQRVRHHSRGHERSHYRARSHVTHHAPRTTVYESRRIDDLVVIDLEEGRRICQRRVRGATAYLQIWSELDDKWVSIRTYPSIW